MAQIFVNNARGTLAGPVIVEDTVIVLENPVNFPTSIGVGEWFLVTVLKENSRYGSNIEIMKVTGVSQSGSYLELTVDRGQDGTTAVAHDMGEKAEARITRQTLESLLAEAQAYTQSEVAALLDSAPGALDTLNELAAALGDDPNFAATVTNALATKLNASAYTAADVLAKLLTVDGPGSGLDADTLDGRQASSFADVSHGHTWLEIADKPAVYPPELHTHDWADIQNKPSAFPAASHGHAWGDLSGIPSYATRWPTFNEVTGKPNTYPPSAHDHAISEVTGLQSALNAKRAQTDTSFPRYDLASAATTATLDLSSQQVFRVDATSNRTLSFANAPGSNRAMTVVVRLTGSSGTVTWPAGIEWAEGTAPELRTAWTAVALLWDGATWRGFVSGGAD